MKKALALAVAGMMVFGLTACGGDSKKEAEPTTAPAETQEAEDTESTDEAADTADGERTTLTVGFDAEFPPYGYMDEDGNYVGFDLDLAEEVCKRNNWKLVKRPISWDAKDSELDTGAISCIWNGFTMNGREKDYTWSTPYVDNSQVVITKKDSGITKLSDLKDKILVV